MKTFSKIAAAVLVTTALAVPASAQRGKADFTRFVTLGDSLTLGVSNVATVHTHQQFSWPAIFARQVGLHTNCALTDTASHCFQQALVSEPGIPGELVLQSLQPLTIGQKPGLGAPMNSGLARPFNNLAVDGAELADAFQVSGDGNEAFSAPIVLRGLGSVVEQAIRLNPTFIGIWYGADDFFGPLQRGSTTGLTPQATFATDYGRLLDQLIAGAPQAGMVVANLPGDVRKIPLVNVVPTVLVNPANNQPVRDPAGNVIPLIAELTPGTFGQLPAGSAILFTAASLLRTGYGIPAALAPLLPPGLPDIGKPLPDAAVLTPAEITAFNTAIAGYNTAINAAATARNIPVVDINSFFDRAFTGMAVGPINVNLGYVTGGLISLDSAHPTDLGYLLIANEFIRTVNRGYGTRIPLASITQLFANNGAFFGADSVAPAASSVPELTSAAASAIRGDVAEADKAPAKSRRRVTGH